MRKSIANEIVERIINEMVPAADLIDWLHSQGYVNDFELTNNILFCKETCTFFALSDFIVDEYYKIEDESRTLCDFYIFALRHKWIGLKGIFSCDNWLEVKNGS